MIHDDKYAYFQITQSFAEPWQQFVVKSQIVIAMAPVTGIAFRTQNQVKDQREDEEEKNQTKHNIF